MLSHISPSALLVIAFFCGMLCACGFLLADQAFAYIAQAYRKQRARRHARKLLRLAFRDPLYS